MFSDKIEGQFFPRLKAIQGKGKSKLDLTRAAKSQFFVGHLISYRDDFDLI